MSVDRTALATVMIYLVFVATAIISDVGMIEPDEFLLAEANHATTITAPFSILFSGVTFIGIDILENNTAAYVIWIASAALNSVVLYMLSSRVCEMIGVSPRRKTVQA